MKTFTLLVVLACSLMCVSCDSVGGPLGPGGDDDDCVPVTAETAVHLRVEDSGGTPTTPTSVQFSYEGGELEDAECVDEACTQWVTGHEDSAGSYSITIELDEPFPNDPWCYFWARETVEVDVFQGECNLNTEEVTVQLQVDVICADGDG